MRMNKRLATKRIHAWKQLINDVVDCLEMEYHDITSKLHELVDEWESKKDEIVFIKGLKYNKKGNKSKM